MQYKQRVFTKNSQKLVFSLTQVNRYNDSDEIIVYHHFSPPTVIMFRINCKAIKSLTSPLLFLEMTEIK